MATSITSAMLYDLVVCPHRATMDIHGQAANRDPVSPLVSLLWTRGTANEADVVRALGSELTDLTDLEGSALERATLDAMARKAPLIYGGRIHDEDLVATPALLRLDDDGYVAGDIRASGDEDGPDSGRKPRRSFAMQLALCTDVLERKDLSAGRYGFIVDGHGEETLYELDAPRGPRSTLTFWQEYLKAVAQAREIVQRRDATRPALSSACRLCVWRTSCRKRLEREDDLTLLPEVGRSARDLIAGHYPTVAALAKADPEDLPDQARRLEGVGAALLRRLHERARLVRQRGAAPYRRAEIELPEGGSEIFFGIAMDAVRDHCYLHGFLERSGGKPRYRGFFAEDASEEAEEKAFADAWAFLGRAKDAAIYHYGPFERTMWRTLQERYPQICDSDEIEELFAAESTVDLFTAVVRPRTEWPTRDYSVESIAGHLGFRWSDSAIPGAWAAEWYEEWLASRDPAVRQRILACNEDHCRATAVILDGVRVLEPAGED